MDSPVTVLSHSAVLTEVSKAQILRYAGMAGVSPDESVEALIKKCYPVMMDAMKFKACYLEAPVTISDNTVDFEYLSIKSANLSNILRGCNKAILVAATAGIQADIVVKRAEVTSKAEALIFNSIAVAGIEKYMGIFSEFLKEQYPEYNLRPRFAPGYGDVPLDVQKELLSVLDTNRKIGVSLADSLLMTPSKSISAVIGLGKEGCVHIDKDCDMCSKRDCEYRLQ